jgi:sec-independent protein translocase protein TatC
MTAPGEHEEEGLVKPFLGHLEDLRRALLGSLAALAAGMGVAAPLAPRILDILRAPLRGVVAHPETFLRTLDVTAGLSVAMQTIFWAGLLFSAPVILFCLARFVFPGLTRRERRAVLAGFAFAAALFVLGVSMGYFLALPAALKAMLWFNAWLGLTVEFFRVTDYIGFALKLLLAFGLTFELPVVLLVLGHLGVVTSAQLRHRRRHAIVAVLALAMIVTPTTDPFSQLLLAVPLIALYELCVWMLWWRERDERPAAA